MANLSGLFSVAFVAEPDATLPRTWVLASRLFPHETARLGRKAHGLCSLQMVPNMKFVCTFEISRLVTNVVCIVVVYHLKSSWDATHQSLHCAGSYVLVDPP